MVKVKQAIIVEGKYDKIRLSNIVDATIITTDGFRIFKDRDKVALIRLLAEKRGIVILTDSDRAGQMIRKHVEQTVVKGNITNVYLPVFKGKEKRKTALSADGVLGVEGTDDEVIINALTAAGIVGEPIEKKGREITKTDLYNIGVSGKEGATEKRASLCSFLGLPDFLPANSLLDVLNSLYGYNDFINEVAKWSRE